MTTSYRNEKAQGRFTSLVVLDLRQATKVLSWTKCIRHNRGILVIRLALGTPLGHKENTKVVLAFRLLCSLALH